MVVLLLEMSWEYKGETIPYLPICSRGVCICVPHLGWYMLFNMLWDAFMRHGMWKSIPAVYLFDCFHFIQEGFAALQHAVHIVFPIIFLRQHHVGRQSLPVGGACHPKILQLIPALISYFESLYRSTVKRGTGNWSSELVFGFNKLQQLTGVDLTTTQALLHQLIVWIYLNTLHMILSIV